LPVVAVVSEVTAAVVPVATRRDEPPVPGTATLAVAVPSVILTNVAVPAVPPVVLVTEREEETTPGAEPGV
jgi:hypothetical protein